MRISDWSSDVGSSYLRFNKSQTSLLVRGFPAGPILQASGSFRATTWNVSALYKIDPDVSLYATVRRGYRAGGCNPAASTPELLAYRPDRTGDVKGKSVVVGGDLGELRIHKKKQQYSQKL